MQFIVSCTKGALKQLESSNSSELESVARFFQGAADPVRGIGEQSPRQVPSCSIDPENRKFWILETSP